MTRTRYGHITLDKVAHEWSFFDITDGPARRVGPIYKTKGEALADLDRYYRDSWMPIATPYPFCRHPEKCTDGRCMAEFCCND